MKPSLIFDKSTLESLNPDEAMWLDQFFLCNITPVFFIETLADLDKKIRNGRSVEDIVGALAYKTPDYSSKVNIHHRTLIEGELSGEGTLNMADRIPHIGGGTTLELGDKRGVIFQPSPEEDALMRWEKHQFLDLERQIAKAWREELSNINLEENYKNFQSFFPIGKPKSLEDVKKIVDFHINSSNQENILKYGMSLIGISPKFQAEVIHRWKSLDQPSLKDFAPYFMHVFAIDLFFYIAISADLIGRGRPSHKIDLAYLYYLPFCKIFTSNDKLHIQIAQLFLKEDQSFVLGSDLKSGLAELDKYYSSLPAEVKQSGVTSFASHPPHDDSFFITKLWDKYLPNDWREKIRNLKPQPESKVGKQIMEEINNFKEKGVLVSDQDKVEMRKSDSMIIERKVIVQKGKWMRFPPEVVNRRKNEKGEWEDIPKQ